MSRLELLSESERRTFFETASAKSGMTTQIIEKDFWVVWILDRLFAIPELKNYLTFKGGTSLSKVYKLIERFSEDVDISIEKEFFGFINDQDPEFINGTNKRNDALKMLSIACEKYVGTTLLEKLKFDIETDLRTQIGWSIYVDPTEKQTLLFEYPTPLSKNSYIKSSIKIEVGARSEHWPAGEQYVQSYVKEILTDKVTESIIKVKVLNAERTFWEKATILHQYAHLPSDKKLPNRISRHYYDFYCLLKSSIKNNSETNIDLLNRVALHKSIYFHSAWASYETAKKGTLLLVPSKIILKDLEKDYDQMSEMFFGKTPLFEDIIFCINEFQNNFNKQ